MNRVPPLRDNGHSALTVSAITWRDAPTTHLLRLHPGRQKRVIYVGVTGFLMARVLKHRAGEGGAFTRSYRVHRLVYFQSFHNIGDAIARETEVKKWRREKKLALIEQRNPTWEDLAEGWGQPTEMPMERKTDSASLARSRVGMTARTDFPHSSLSRRSLPVNDEASPIPLQSRTTELWSVDCHFERSKNASLRAFLRSRETCF